MCSSSPSSRFSVSLNRNIGKFRAKKYSIDHRTAYAMQLFIPMKRKPYHIFCFWLRREDRQMSIIEQLLYQTDKSCHRRCSIKKLFVKSFQFSQESSVLKSLLGLGCNKVIIKRLQDRCFPVNISKFLITSVFEEHLRTAASENDNKKRFFGKATGHNDH